MNQKVHLKILKELLYECHLETLSLFYTDFLFIARYIITLFLHMYWKILVYNNVLSFFFYFLRQSLIFSRKPLDPVLLSII